MKKSWLVLGLTLACAQASFAVVATNGTETPIDSVYTWVGQVNGASCVAIGSRTVVTARHVGAGPVTIAGNTYNVLSSATSSDYDITVINLTSDLPGWYNIGTSIQTGATITMVGYGISGGVNANGNGYDLNFPGGTRHAGNNTIDFFQNVDYGDGSHAGPSMLSLLDAAPEAAVAAGDSGGGWFANGNLVGLSLFTFNLTDGGSGPLYGDYGFGSANTNGFNVNGNVGGPGDAYFGSGALNLTDAGVRSFITANTVPEPASLIAIGTGIAAALARRRKKA